MKKTLSSFCELFNKLGNSLLLTDSLSYEATQSVVQRLLHGSEAVNIYDGTNCHSGQCYQYHYSHFRVVNAAMIPNSKFKINR